MGRNMALHHLCLRQRGASAPCGTFGLLASRASAGGSALAFAPVAARLISLHSGCRPEFLNRLDEIIVFRQLTKSEVKQIADIMLKQVFKRAEEKGIKIDVTGACWCWIRGWVLNEGSGVGKGVRWDGMGTCRVRRRHASLTFKWGGGGWECEVWDSLEGDQHQKGRHGAGALDCWW